MEAEVVVSPVGVMSMRARLVMPSLASWRAVAAPIPEPAPVMKATLFGGNIAMIFTLSDIF